MEHLHRVAHGIRANWEPETGQPKKFLSKAKSPASLTVHGLTALTAAVKAGLLRHFTTLPRKRCWRVGYAKSVATHETLTCIASMQRLPVIRKTFWLGGDMNPHMTDAAQQLRLSSALNLDLPSFCHRVKDLYVVEPGPAAHQVLPGPAAQAPPQNAGNALANVVPEGVENHIANHAVETVATTRPASNSNAPAVQTGEHGLVATATAASSSDANPARVGDGAETATNASTTGSGAGTVPMQAVDAGSSGSAGPMSQQSRKG